MNKKLLALAALAAMAIPSISAAEVSLLNAESIHGNAVNVPFGEVMTPVDGVYSLEITADPAEAYTNQLFIVADKKLAAGQKYSFKIQVKSTVARTVNFQAQGDPGAYMHWTIAGGDLEVGTDWTLREYTGEVPAEANDMQTIALNLSTGPEACTMSFKDIVWTVEETGETPEQPEQPEQPEGVVAEWYTGNGATIGGWGGNATRENVDEDGKPCLKFTNAEAAANPWDIQLGLDVTLEFDKTYYISFDIKGTPAEGLGAGIQNSEDYSGKGDFTTFNITETWNHAVIEATCTQAEGKESPANRITFNLGKYVGTFYMTNVVLSTTKPAGLDAVEVAPVVNHWTVYNLMGVKVLDTDNEAAVNELANGIYVINGKKVAIRK